MFGNERELDLTEPIPGGSYKDIQGVRVFIPPIPEIHLIQNYDKEVKDQKWERQGYPEWWQEEYEKELDERVFDDEYRNPRCEAFREECWRKRNEGHWVFINGMAIYLPGMYWYYLEWIKNDNGYPDFREPDWLEFLFTTVCFQLERCLGYIKIGPRGFGKTSKEVAITLEKMTKRPGRRQAAIQSKSEDDAKEKIFQEKMVPVYLELPEFFQPEADHGTKPEKKLSFFKPAVRGKKSKRYRVDEESELKNLVYYVPAKEKALDGGTYAIVIQDEIGKTDPKKEADVNKRWDVNRFCVYRDHKKRGMLLGTSTIEELKAGGDECYMIWKNSDPKNLTGNGFTVSGAYRYFTSALDVTFFDEYGFPDRVRAKEFHDAERKARKDDPNALSSYIRKNPYNADEAFMEDGDGCEFNSYILNKRLEELNLKEPVTIGNFEWTNGRDSKLIFDYNPKGRFKCSWLPYKDEETNLVAPAGIIEKEDGTKIQAWKPLNDIKFRIGTDPVDHGVETVDVRTSDSAAYVFRLYDMAEDTDPERRYTEEDTKDELDYKNGKLKWKTYLPVVEYIYRNDDPEDYYEDMIKLCRFFGCQILPETQKRTIITWFRNRGYGEFIKYRPKDTFTNDSGNQNTPGIASVEPVIQQYIGLIKTYVMHHGHRIPFKRLVLDLIKFRKSKIRVHDPTVALGFTLLATLGEAKVVEKPAELNDFFRSYRIRGTETELVK
jgi:hypothetical protein